MHGRVLSMKRIKRDVPTGFPTVPMRRLPRQARSAKADTVTMLSALRRRQGVRSALWVDQATHLIDRFVEQQGEDVQIIRLLDYRLVGSVRLPFTIRIGDGDPQWDEVDTLQSAVPECIPCTGLVRTAAEPCAGFSVS